VLVAAGVVCPSVLLVLVTSTVVEAEEPQAAQSAPGQLAFLLSPTH